jgi:hypothetical protein
MNTDETILNFKDILNMSFDDNGFRTIETETHYGGLASWARVNNISQKEVVVCIRKLHLPSIVGCEPNICLELNLVCIDYKYMSSYFIESSLRSFYKRITKYGWCKDGNKKRQTSNGVPPLSVLTIKLKKLEQ